MEDFQCVCACMHTIRMGAKISEKQINSSDWKIALVKWLQFIEINLLLLNYDYYTFYDLMSN